MEELLAKILELLSSVEGASATVAIVLEFVFRMIPTKKPLGLLHMIASSAKLLGEALLKLAALLDKVLPQKIKE
jgi:hypothetical protein